MVLLAVDSQHLDWVQESGFRNTGTQGWALPALTQGRSQPWKGHVKSYVTFSFRVTAISILMSLTLNLHRRQNENIPQYRRFSD